MRRDRSSQAWQSRRQRGGALDGALRCAPCRPGALGPGAPLRSVDVVLRLALSGFGRGGTRSRSTTNDVVLRVVDDKLGCLGAAERRAAAWPSRNLTWPAGRLAGSLGALASRSPLLARLLAHLMARLLAHLLARLLARSLAASWPGADARSLLLA